MYSFKYEYIKNLGLKIHDLVYRHDEHHNSLYGHTLALHVYTKVYCNDWVALRNLLATFAA